MAPLPFAGTSTCGLWLGTASADFIFYEAHTSSAHQDHIILHELGHVLCHEHDGSLDEDLLRTLFPALSPALVHQALGRTRYSAVEEQEAEVFAYLVQERVWRTRATPAELTVEGSANAHTHEVLRKIARQLER
ncbi:ImmA/IrrE family metallo-endopeptidase [Actinophytocola xanthii]|uniref:Uncharacterized protein n=1 Tax=Actinophytocola xanthii TaxID=1912961 RepID=A0A1Q8C8W4_9PSEU|nr:ImmA/IrrE family metallo-endopeptidase [Actinophytocola xanthii]OLF10814.1 hypothetical protein BU204_30855 [Actinophytocola xanthii]